MEKVFPEILARSDSIEEELNHIIRSITRLLNTRNFEELNKFIQGGKKYIMSYGLPDISHLSLSEPSDIKIIVKSIQKAIENFEPRFHVRGIEIKRNTDEKYNFLVGVQGNVILRDKKIAGIEFSVPIIRS
jgi:type VI secretion system lysozyme-like protein